MASSSLPQWPPEITDQQREALTLLATTYALSHGLTYLPPADVQPTAPTSAIHAPLALFPSPIPRKQFELSKRLQHVYNVLYARVAMDEVFLDRVMGAEEGVGRVDEFTGRLWRIWKRLRDQGISQFRHLGLFRSDYLLHAPQPESGEPLSVQLKQVEFNTISSSFGALSQNAAGLHRYLAATTEYYNSSPFLRSHNLPPNETIAGLVEGLAAAHKAYNSPSAYILFVVQGGERNVYDQRWLEYELVEKHAIRVIRQTFEELSGSAEVVPTSRILRIKLPGLLPRGAESVEISTVYFRAGYTPNDYPTPVHYETRYLLEKSIAIKCPSVQLQLAGGKKVQQVLTHSDIAVYITDETCRRELQSSWMEMWGLDDEHGGHLAQWRPESLVLKPQREGGGNNVYKGDIPGFLETLPSREREAWIAMELIQTPEGLGNYLVRAGSGTEGAVKTEVVSELGIFGWALFGGPEKEIEEKEVGWLLRTKGKDSNEGGVAAGFSVLDSVVLVD